ncbi:MAG TPA: ABC transporter permease [Bacillota bacterium]|jgi:ABC-type dipeptide/oligopeptide/nickel transport system permease component
MRAYLIRRILLMVPVVLGVTVVVFLIIHLAPGDPVLLLVGERAPPEIYERVKHAWGLDRPLLTQYFSFLGNVLKGDLGMSIQMRRPVAELLARAIPVTLELGVAAMGLAVTVGVVSGVVSAARAGSATDQVTMVGALLGVSVPGFWLGQLLILLVAVELHWLPPSGYGGLKYLIMPALAMGFADAALTARTTRSSMLEVIRQDFIRTARAKGLTERVVIYRHALRNALLPVVTLIGLDLGYLIGGAVIMEEVFGRPGMGRLMIHGILSRDYPVVQGCLLFLAVSVALCNLLADIAYVFLDPRIRLQ